MILERLNDVFTVSIDTRGGHNTKAGGREQSIWPRSVPIPTVDLFGAFS